MRRSKSLLALACIVIGFLVVITVRSRPADPEGRLPRRYRLAALIERQQRTTAHLSAQVVELRARVEKLRTETAGRQAGRAAQQDVVRQASLQAGLAAVRGSGLRVTMDDSLKGTSTSGDVNDLVIHSQDVQAVVNAMWRSGAEAVAINRLRLVGTSAVLCVGNTLLLNGTVQSPPYVVVAIGASRDRFEADRLVRRLHGAAKSFGLRFSVTRDSVIDVPAFKGATDLRYAHVAS